jgi:hypothetical protein
MKRLAIGGSMPSQPELLDSPEHLGHLGHQHGAIRSAPGKKPAIGAELRIGWFLKPATEYHRLLRTVPSPYPDTNNGVAIPQSIRQPRPGRADRTYSAIRVTGGPAARDFEEARPFARSAATGEQPPAGIQGKGVAIARVRSRQPPRFQFDAGSRVVERRGRQW